MLATESSTLESIFLILIVCEEIEKHDHCAHLWSPMQPPYALRIQ